MANEKTTSEDEVRHALNHVDSRDREMWLRMGAGIKSELGKVVLIFGMAGHSRQIITTRNRQNRPGRA